MPTGKRLTPSLEYLSERFPKDNAPVVLFDPGHGGMIDGVYQTDKRFDINKPGSYTKGYVHSMGVGIAEGEFNRDIMNRVCKYMDMVGLPYKKIVDTEEDVPLRKRSDDINEYYYNENKRCFVCSIHANAGKGTGKEIFTSPGETNADPMAEIMILRMDDDLPELRLRADKSDGDHDKEAKFWMVTKTAPPAFLIECAFMDTLKPDCELMISDEGRERFAKSIFYGLVEIIENYEKIVA